MKAVIQRAFFTALIINISTWAISFAGWSENGRVQIKPKALFKSHKGLYAFSLMLILLSSIVSHSQDFELVGTYAVPSASAISFFNEYVYLCTQGWDSLGYDSLDIVDISNPRNPTLVGRWGQTMYTNSICADSSFVFMANSSYGIDIIDVSIPGNPSRVGLFYNGMRNNDIAEKGHYVYLVNYYGMSVIDIYDVTSPSYVSCVYTPHEASGIFLSDSCAFVTDFYGEFCVINVTDPLNPELIGSCNTPGQAMRCLVRGSYAYIADGSAGLQIINIANRANPSILAGCEIPDGAESIALDGNFAYLTGFRIGIRVVDISDAQNPIYIAGFDTSSSSPNIMVVNNLIYWVRSPGLQILHFMANDVEDNSSILPSKIEISAYPNPFNSATTISYSNLQDVEIRIFDIKGSLIKTLKPDNKSAGSIIWNADNNSGGKISSGVYFARAKGNNNSSTIKLIYLK